MNRFFVRWGALGVLAVVFSCPACGSEGDTASNAGGTGQGGTSGIGGTGGTGGSTTGGTAGSTQGGTGGTASQTEVCDGLDNNGDGVVDEGCPCSVGDVQDCYPMPAAPPLGCKMGTQTCLDSGWGPCTGVRMPAPGEDSCCTEIGNNPTFEVYDAFVAANPAASMPESIDALTAFMPKAGEYKMKWSEVVPGDEFVDHKIGGLSEANINAGRAFARARAEEAVPADATIVATKEEPVSVKVLSGDAPCNGVGWGWGSLLYQRLDFSVGEMVYLYVGYCAELPTRDAEAFFYSEEPVVVCQAPIVK